MLNKILSEDWSDYDQKKKDDSDVFSCDEWEQEYLANKMIKYYPEYPERLVKRAIAISCKELRPPRSRKSVVHRAINNLVFLVY